MRIASLRFPLLNPNRHADHQPLFGKLGHPVNEGEHLTKSLESRFSLDCPLIGNNVETAALLLIIAHVK
jgi:hypothetical protein